jgi:hypothetical protein
MKLRASLLVAVASIPFIITKIGIPGFVLGQSTAYYRFCLASGLVWCASFLVALATTTASQRRRLLWLLPLSLFAFGIPIDYLLLLLALSRGGSHGELP